MKGLLKKVIKTVAALNLWRWLMSNKINDDTSIYQQHGYDNRQHYLESLAEEHGVDLETVQAVAELYGQEEDFDGLVTSIGGM